MLRISKPVLSVLAVLSVIGCTFIGCAFNRDSLQTTSTTPTQASAKSKADGIIHPEKWPLLPPSIPRDEALEKRIDALLQKMTVEEKVGQTLMAEVGDLTPEDVRKYDLGSVLAGGSSAPNNDIRATPEVWLQFADAFYKASVDKSDGGVGIPVLWGIDAVHGHNNIVGATIFPHNIGLGAAGDPELVRRIGAVTALEMTATGQDWNFAPSLYIPRDGRWGRVYEGFSEDSKLASELAKAAIVGLQGSVTDANFLGAPHVVSTAKTWLGDGDMAGGVDQGDVQQDEATMRDVHSAPFAAAIQAGAQTVMASFSSYHGKAMHGHQPLLTEVLRGRYNFDGLVVGDWDGHHKIKGCSQVNCPQALIAGLDIYMAPQSWKALRENLLLQVKDGTLPMNVLDGAVRRILRVKLRAGIFESGLPSTRGVDLKVLGAPEHWQLAREAVRRSLVLLKNDGVLPISPKAHILVTGQGADDISMQNGGWSLTWQGTETTAKDFPQGKTLLKSLREVMKQSAGKLTYSEDGNFNFDEKSKPDVAIVVFGETAYAEWRGDRPNVDYDNNRALNSLHKLQAAGIPTVSVFYSGRPLYVNPELNASNAFVAAWLPGSAGNGITDVLIANVNGKPVYDFEGKLPFSWPSTPMQNRFSDEDFGKPLFPLGYGGSYAKPAALKKLKEIDPVLAGLTNHSVIFFSRGKLLEGAELVAVYGEEIAPLADAKGQTAKGEIVVRSVDRNAQEDAREFHFKGEQGSVIFEVFPKVPAEKKAKIQLDISPLVKMEKNLSIALECIGGGSAKADLKDALNSIPIGEWQTISLPIQCTGDLPSERQALIIKATGSASFRLSDLRLEVDE